MTNEEIRNVVMLELVAPSHECFGETFPSGMDKTTEDPEKRIISKAESDELYLRYNEPRACTDAPRNWAYVFEPIKDEGFRNKMIQLYKTLDNDNEG